MATKSGIISAINGYITAVLNIANHRLSMLEIVNELWQTTTVQTLETGSNVFWYKLYYKKVGNIVYVNGYIQNKYSIAKTSQTIVTIPNSQYYAKTAQDTVSYFGTSSGTNVLMSFSAASIYLIESLAANQIVRINHHYQTND